MTNNEKRQALTGAVISREGKNRYTQSSKREQVASGWSDCSSLTRWAYQQIGLEIGDNTEAQMLSKQLYNVIVPIDAGIPRESYLMPGDLLYFRGRNTSRGATQYVGHVEMYVGDGQISGHGSGTGPTRKDMVTYCKQRLMSSSPVPAGNRGLICVRRAVIFAADEEQQNEIQSERPGELAEEEVEMMRDLVRGDKGYGEIATLQRCLKSLGYYEGEIDHSFGAGTETAVKAFQSAKGIAVNYPGTVGPKTWTVLLTQC